MAMNTVTLAMAWSHTASVVLVLEMIYALAGAVAGASEQEN